MKPTGRPHLGNYFGALKQFVDLQDKYESMVFIADLHALTTIKDQKFLSEATTNQAIDYLAIGLDPNKTLIFKQSDVPEVTELAWIFSCLLPVPYLMRAHAYKDALNKNKDINAGVFNYPILMAADILIQDSEVVPVGKDQRQHVEYARDIANKFNDAYGQTFKIPQELVIEEVETVPGLDGQKMSKSYKNTIPLFAEKEEINKLIMQIPTDSLGVNDPKNPNESIIFKIHSLILNENEKEKLSNRFLQGGLGYKEAKENLARDLYNFIKPFKDKRNELEKNKKYVLEIIEKGGIKAKEKAENKMNEIRKKIGLKI